MPNPDALAVVQAAVSLTRSHPHAPALDVLDLVLKGRIDTGLDFASPAVATGSRPLTTPSPHRLCRRFTTWTLARLH
jgi:hypothetical protein